MARLTEQEDRQSARVQTGFRFHFKNCLNRQRTAIPMGDIHTTEHTTQRILLMVQRPFDSITGLLSRSGQMSDLRHGLRMRGALFASGATTVANSLC